MTQPRLPKFWEVWGEAEARYNVVRLYAASVTVLAALLVGVVAYMAGKPTPVLIVPGAEEASILKPGRMTETYVEDTAKSFVLSFANWNYSTVDQSFQSVRAMMDRAILAEFDLRAADRIEEIRRNQISESFHPSAVKLSSQEGDRYVVHLEGIKETYVGTKPVWSGGYYYDLVMKKKAPTLSDPRALAVVKLSQGEMKPMAQAGTGSSTP
ncbi:MAG: hypothetical protein HYT87_05770 [Nitrospirae bacterium]|nr:hypothetical protein [Nitrospirota bacterium]